MTPWHRWLAYERYCIRPVVEALRSVPEARRLEPSYQRAVTLLGHLAVALECWLARVDGEAQSAVALFPTNLSVEEAAHRIDRALDRWGHLLSRLNAEELERTVSYRTTSGVAHRNTLADILAHLLAHGAYHRGQIMLLVRQLEGVPTQTDFIVWARTTQNPA
ncbi:hypothetical protein HRbin18_02057 [bacterium HR18]|nr:hypothetical protein HRbin18_02057 [bacterium HR18]